jgi:hypothetical protein
MSAMRWAAAAALAGAAAAPLEAQTWRTVTSARQTQREQSLDVTVTYAAGRFSLSPAAGGTLYRMELRYDEERFIPVREYDASTGSLRLGVRGRDGMRVRMRDRSRREPPPSLDLALTPDVPMALVLELGAAQADVELGGLALHSVRYRTGASETNLRFSRPNSIQCESLRMEAGAAAFRASQLANSNCRNITFDGGVGEVTLDFTGTWRQPVTADIRVGIGTLNLRLPRDVGVSIRLSRFLASFDQAGFTRRGNTWYSGNWDEARQKLTLNVDAAIGGVEVTWVTAR